MRRRELLRAGLTTGAIAVSGCLGGSGDITFRDGFEDGLGEWEGGGTIGPEVDPGDFEWAVEVSDAEAASGDRSLRIWNEGTYDDGVTWGVHSIPIEPGRRYRADVSAELWSESASFNTIQDAVTRLGPDPPRVEEDLPHPGVNSTDLGETPYGGLREPLWLAEGWREYRFEWTTPEFDADTLHVAVGTNVIWEGDATHYVDDVAVEVARR